MKNDVARPTFITDHLALAAFLMCVGHAAALVRSSSKKILFQFDQSEILEEDISAFGNGTAKVSPAAYDSARIRLRQKMDALKGGVQ